MKNKQFFWTKKCIYSLKNEKFKKKIKMLYIITIIIISLSIVSADKLTAAQQCRALHHTE